MTEDPSPAHSHAFWRLKRLRQAHGLSLEALAVRSGLTKSFISKVERGASVPSIASALKLADAFGIGIGELFGADPEARDITLVRRGERQPFTRPGAIGHRYEAIALAPAGGQFEAIIDRPPFERPPGHRPAEHRGKELIFVVKGKVEVSFPHQSIRLAPGDTLMFDARIPHHVLSLRPHQGEILVIVTPEHPGAGTAAASR